MVALDVEALGTWGILDGADQDGLPGTVIVERVVLRGCALAPVFGEGNDVEDRRGEGS